MRETQHIILQHVKRGSAVTVNELADALGIATVTVRHHLYALMADGLIEREPVRNGVGRPEHRYSLTDKGYRQFPSRYHALTTHLLNALRHVTAPDAMHHVLVGALRHTLNLPGHNGAPHTVAQLRELEAHLHAHDIPARLTVQPDNEAQLELRCPFYAVSQQHVELCGEDERIVQDTLQLPLTRTGCLLVGDKSCTFSIKIATNSTSITPNGNLSGSQS